MRRLYFLEAFSGGNFLFKAGYFSWQPFIQGNMDTSFTSILSKYLTKVQLQFHYLRY